MRRLEIVKAYLLTVVVYLYEHPAVVRVALFALPILLALGVSLLTHSPVHAFPPNEGGRTNISP